MSDDRCDDGSAPLSVGGLTWRLLCEAHELRQPGTRTRGWRRWSLVYYANACVECGSPGSVTINDGVLGFANGRFALCHACVKSSQFWRVQRRPEIAGAPAKLAHLLFRIATIRRELGYKRAASPGKPKRTGRRSRGS